MRQDFINQVLDFDEHTDLANSVISWCGKNTINGLLYGNGGLKCWPKDFVLNMRCLLYTSPSPRDRQKSRMPSSA